MVGLPRLYRRNRDNSAGTQPPQEKQEHQSAESEDSADNEPGRDGLVEFGQHQPPLIGNAADQDQDAYNRHKAAAAFARARKQREKRDEKSAGGRDEERRGPGAGNAGQIPGNLAPEVLLPDDQELAEIEVGPKYRCGEQDGGE